MRANPIYLLFLLVTLFSCDDPEKRIYTSAELMNDRVFVSYIETNNAILQKLNNAAGYSEDQRKDYIEKLRTVISNNETNEIYLTLVYTRMSRNLLSSTKSSSIAYRRSIQKFPVQKILLAKPSACRSKKPPVSRF